MFIDNLKEELNVSTTENGALGYATTGKELLDFNFKVAFFFLQICCQGTKFA